MVSPLRPQEMPALPHFSESASWRMITTLLWMGLLACIAAGLWWYGRSTSEHFLTGPSLQGIWRNAFPLVLLVGPMAVIMLAGGLDLSIGAVAALASVVTASALADGQSPADAFLLALLISGGIGLLHALLIGVAAINPVILTLLTTALIHAAAMFYTDGLRISICQDMGFLESLHSSPLLVGVSIGVPLLLIQLAQIGGGSGGMPVARRSWYRRVFFVSLPYVLSSLAAGVVGCFMAGYLHVGDATADPQMPFMAILAAVIGGNCTGRRFGTVIGAIVGALILVAFDQLMNMVEEPPIYGSLLIIVSAAGIALLLSQLTYWIINLIYRKSRGGIGD